MVPALLAGALLAHNTFGDNEFRPGGTIVDPGGLAFSESNLLSAVGDLYGGDAAQAVEGILSNAFLCTALGLSAQPQAQGGLGQPPSVSAPLVAPPNQDAFLNASWDMVGRISIQTLAKACRIQWLYDAGAGVVSYTEQFDLSYWPTAAVHIDEDTILVSGKRPANGNTVIERWDLSWQDYPETTPTTTSKATLFDRKQAGKKVVRCMQGLAAPSNLCLTVFEDSDDLYLLDATTGVLTLLYTPIQVPKLSESKINETSAAEHPVKGYTYIFSSDHQVYGLGGILFFDLDKDGDIDEFQEVDLVDWPTEVALVDWLPL